MPTLTQALPAWFQTHYVPGASVQFRRNGGMLRKYAKKPVSRSANKFQWKVVSKADVSDTPSGAGHQIVTNQQTHGTVEATVKHFDSAAWLNKDEVAQFENADARNIYMMEQMNACGVHCDDIMVNALVADIIDDNRMNSATTNNEFSLDHISATAQALSDAEVGYGTRVMLVSPASWRLLMKIPQFASSDYISDAAVWTKRDMEAPRIFAGCTVISYTGLPLSSTNVRTNFMYDTSVLGYADNGKIDPDMQWYGDRYAWWLNHHGSCASKVILPEGMRAVYSKETPVNLDA